MKLGDPITQSPKLDDDRIYFIDPSQFVRVVDDHSEHITTELVPTDDPNTYIMRITAPVPRFYVKQLIVK